MGLLNEGQKEQLKGELSQIKGPTFFLIIPGHIMAFLFFNPIGWAIIGIGFLGACFYGVPTYLASQKPLLIRQCLDRAHVASQNGVIDKSVNTTAICAAWAEQQSTFTGMIRYNLAQRKDAPETDLHRAIRREDHPPLPACSIVGGIGQPYALSCKAGDDKALSASCFKAAHTPGGFDQAKYSACVSSQ